MTRGAAASAALAVALLVAACDGGPHPASLRSARPSPGLAPLGALSRAGRGDSSEGRDAGLQPTAGPTRPAARPSRESPLPARERAAARSAAGEGPRRLTSGGCCTLPFWGAGSDRVLYLDRPAPDEPAGIWAVDADAAQPVPERVLDVGFYTQDLAYRIDVAPGTTTLSRLADPARGVEAATWSVPAGGESVSLSPGRRRIAWTVSDPNASFQRRVSAMWVANLDGSEARRVASLLRGGFSGWLSDDRLLWTERADASGDVALSTHDLAARETREVARADRMRGTLLAPGGRWLVYHVTVTGDPSANGFFLVDLAVGGTRRLPADLLGGYQWRDGRRLVVVPYRPDAEWHALVELDVETGATRTLVDPAATPIKIANGDWTVSPDGRRLAWVDARDRNIWTLALP